MKILIGIVALLAIVFVVLIIRTIKLTRLETPPFPLEEEEEHLFSERPFPHEEETMEMRKVSQKDKVITHLMVYGTISKQQAKDLGISKLPMHIHRLRKLYKIDNVIVDGKFSRYKLIEYKGK